jgi:hypothetical protein
VKNFTVFTMTTKIVRTGMATKLFMSCKDKLYYSKQLAPHFNQLQSNVTPELQPTECEDSVKEGKHYLVANHDYSFVLCRRSNDLNTDEFQVQNHNISQNLNGK